MTDSSRFNRKPSAKYKQAVEILRELLSQEGADTVTRAYAEATWESHQREFVEKNGLKPARDGHACIHRLKGERCPKNCQSPMDIPAADHVSEWKKDGKTYVIMSQPYGVSFGQLKKITEFCDANGLEASIDARPSWHFPGSVLTIEYKRSDREKEDR